MDSTTVSLLLLVISLVLLVISLVLLLSLSFHSVLRVAYSIKLLKRFLNLKKKLYLKFSIIENNLIIKEGVVMLALTKTQKATIGVQAFDSSVPPVEAVVENITFASSDESVCTVVQDPTNPTQAEVIAHADGVAQILVSADADLGEGTLPISGTLNVEVQSIIATGFSFTVGTPLEQ